METGRQIKEIEEGMFIQENITVNNQEIKIILTTKDIEIRQGLRIINRFGYSGEIKKSIISDLATVLVDIECFDKKKEARTWIVNNNIFTKINSLKRLLNTKIDLSQQQNKIDEAIMVFNDDYINMSEKFWKIQPFYYDKNNIWWLWNFKNKFWEIIDEVDLMNRLRNHLSPHMNITHGNVFSQIIKGMQMVGREKKPKEAPKKWIQFTDKAFSVSSKKIYDVTQDYFFTNPLPWEIGKTSDTPFMDKLFNEWVGEEYVSTLYEIIAYCCYTDYPIQVLFCLYGGGRNGKSCFLKLLSNFLGTNNLCSTDLDLLVGRNKSRFEIFKLYKKLACLLGETNFGILESSAILKKLTGSDLIGFEIKGKKPFDDYNYAKILIASNSLPSSEDTSEGFYRRWVIIDFPNKFKEGKDITEDIPNQEYNALAKKVCEIIPKLLEKGEFTNQGTIKERKDKYILASNPLPFFIEKFCYQDPNGYIRYSELFTAYSKFLTINNRRIVSKKEFSSRLTGEGFETRRTSKEGQIDQYVEGLKWQKEDHDFGDFADFKELLLQPTHIGTKVQTNEIGEIIEKPDFHSQNDHSTQETKVLETIEEETIVDNFIYKYDGCASYIKADNKNNCPIEDFIKKFNEATMDKMLSTGDVIESPPGYLKVL